MEITTSNIILVSSVLLLLGVVSSKTSNLFGLPTLILFLALGVLAGSEGLLGINFDNASIAQFIGVVALNFILFSGGLETRWDNIRPILARGVVLSTAGVFLTALTLGVFVWYITDFTLLEGILLGSIVSSTDAAAVFSILRSKSVALKNNLRPTLELESGSNDPMAYLLTITFTGLVVNQDQSLWSIVPMFFQQMVVGALGGFLVGMASKWMINRIRLEVEGLYPVLLIGLMYFTFSGAEFLGGNGFLAIYIQAVYLANQDLIHKNSIIKFFDGVAWLMQIVLFITLGLLVFPSSILPIVGLGLIISLFLIVVARPLAVFLCLAFFKMKDNERVFISWVGLRGAVPIVFATYPLLAGIESANMIFHLVFFISLTSVLLQGTSLSLVAKWLKVDLPNAQPRRQTSILDFSENMKSELTEVVLPPDSPANGKEIVQLGFPKNALIVMINRDGNFIMPSGSTRLEANDNLMILAEKEEDIKDAYASLGL